MLDPLLLGWLNPRAEWFPLHLTGEQLLCSTEKVSYSDRRRHNGRDPLTGRKRGHVKHEIFMGALASLLMHLCLQNTSGWGSGEREGDAAGRGHPGHGAGRRRVRRAGWSGDKGNLCLVGEWLVMKDLLDTAEGNKGSCLSAQPSPVTGVPGSGGSGAQALLSLPCTPLSPCSPQRLASICTGTSLFPQNSLPHIYWGIMR